DAGGGGVGAVKIVVHIRLLNRGTIFINSQIKVALLQVVDHGVAQQAVQIALGGLGSVDGLGVLREGSDVSGLVSPLNAGTAEVILSANLVVLLQVAVVQLLTQLHDSTLGAAGAGASFFTVNRVSETISAGDVVVLHIVVDDNVANRDAAAGRGLNHAGLQSVQNHLGHVVTGHSLSDSGLHAIEQTNLAALAHGGQLP